MKITQIEHIEKGIIFGLGDDNKLYFWNSRTTTFELFTFEIAVIIDDAFKAMATAYASQYQQNSPMPIKPASPPPEICHHTSYTPDCAYCVWELPF